MGLGPSLPVVKTPGFHCRWGGFDPWPAAKIGHAWVMAKKRKRERERNRLNVKPTALYIVFLNQH